MAARVLVAVNPSSGRRRGAEAGERLVTALRAAGHHADALAADDGDAFERAVRTRIEQDAPDAVVAVGGDGTVNLVLNAAMPSGTPLGIVAAGTGNDIARCLGLPHDDPPAAIRRVVAALAGDEPRTRPVDAARVSTGRWFMGVLSAGFDAIVNERANTLKRLSGTPRYIVALLLELVRLRPRRYRVTIDRDTRRLDAVLVSVANSASLGGGMRIAPHAAMDDGLLDVLVVTPLTRGRLLLLFPRVFRGTHVGDVHGSIERGRVITIDTGDRLPAITAYADGERLGPLPVTIEAVAGAVRLLG